MKSIKKILSGVMSLIMAASAMSATAVNAGAAVTSDGKHEFAMATNTVFMLDDGTNKPYAARSFYLKNIEDSEWADLDSADKKGMVLFELYFYADENNYLKFEGYYNDGKFALTNLYENETSLAGKVRGDAGKNYFTNPDGSESAELFVFTDLDKETYEKYKYCQYMKWSLNAFSDGTYDIIPEASYGWNQYASNSLKFEGEEAKTETETTKDISALAISEIKSQTYTGKAIKPAVTIKDGDKTLVKDTDYTVSYKNNKKIGKATATITGKGDYTGEKTIEFKIVPKKTTLKVSKKSDKKATFSWSKVSGAEKYEIYYSTDGGKKYKKLTTVAGSKTSYTNSKLNFKKYDYKFKIRSYGTSEKTKYYSSYSKIVTKK